MAGDHHPVFALLYPHLENGDVETERLNVHVHVNERGAAVDPNLRVTVRIGGLGFDERGNALSLIFKLGAGVAVFQVFAEKRVQGDGVTGFGGDIEFLEIGLDSFFNSCNPFIISAFGSSHISNKFSYKLHDLFSHFL